jgi:hypothetical protein
MLCAKNTALLEPLHLFKRSGEYEQPTQADTQIRWCLVPVPAPALQPQNALAYVDGAHNGAAIGPDQALATARATVGVGDSGH